MATTKKETATKGFNFDDFNKGKPVGAKENNGFENKEYTLVIKSMTADKANNKDGEEMMYFQIELVEQNKEFFTNARQYFKIDEDGRLKSFIYPEWVSKKDNKKMPSSVMWEIIHLIKEFSPTQEQEYEDKKAKLIEQFGEEWFSPKLFEGMKFKIRVAEVTSNKDGQKYFIPQFSKQRLDREERMKERQKQEESMGDNSEVVDKVMNGDAEDSFNPDDLPF